MNLNRAHVESEAKLSSRLSNRSLIRWLLAGALSVVALLGGWVEMSPPPAQPSSAPADTFSAERASAHQDWLSGPRPVGSARHEEVRERLVNELKSMGLDVAEQDGLGMQSSAGTPYRIGRVRNVIANTKPAGQRNETLVIVAHYDTVPVSGGANDDGGQVTVMLEVARAFLAAGRQTDRNMAFVFIDGEEPGHLGADVLVDDPDLLGNVRFVLNLDSRGSGGPAVPFRHNGEVMGALRTLSGGGQPLVISSASNALFGLLASGTDFGTFSDVGWNGLDQAYFARALHYDNALDTAEAVDNGTIQHSGEQVLLLADAWAVGLDPGGPVPDGAVYFDFFTTRMVLVPWPVMLGLTLLAIAAWLLLLLGSDTSIGAAAKAGLAVFASLLVSVIVAQSVLPLVRLLTAGRPISVSQGDFPGSPFINTIVIVAAVASAMLLVRLSRSGRNPVTRAYGLALVGLVLTMLSLLLLPGVAYIPALGSVAALAAIGATRLVASSSTLASPYVAVGGLLTAVVVGLLGAFAFVAIAVFSSGLAGLGALVVAFGVLTIDTSSTALSRLATTDRSTLEAGFVGTRPSLSLLPGIVAGSIALIVLATLVLPVYRDAPRFDTLLYCYDSADQQGRWASLDPLLDDVTERYIGSRPERVGLGSCLPPGPNLLPFGEVEGLVGESEDSGLDYAGPTIADVTDSMSDEGRVVTFAAQAAPGARLLNLWLVPAEGESSVPRITSSKVDGTPIPPGPSNRGWDRWAVTIHNPGDADLTFSLFVDDDAPVAIRAAYLIDELPVSVDRDANTFAASTASITSTPFRDATIVAQTFPFNERTDQ